MPKKRPRREVWSINPKFSRVAPSAPHLQQVASRVKELCGKPILKSQACNDNIFNIKEEKSKLHLCCSLKNFVDAGMPPILRERKTPVSTKRLLVSEIKPKSICESSVSAKMKSPLKEFPLRISEPKSKLRLKRKLKLEKEQLNDSKKLKLSTENKVDVKTPVDTVQIKQVRKKSKSRIPIDVKCDSSSALEDDDNEEVFDARFKNDYNYVLAKFTVRGRGGFNSEANDKATGFRKKMLRIIKQADIWKLKSALDGTVVSAPKNFTIPSEVSQSKVIPEVSTPRCSSPLRLSHENSPDISMEENLVIKEDEEDNMPVFPNETVKKEEKKDPNNNPKRQSSISKKKLLNSKFYSSQTVSRPEIPEILCQYLDQSLKKVSFKIPKQEKLKLKETKWAKNGKLWTWALTVDENCQFSRSQSGRKKVPWANKVKSRPCEEFQEWLVRGSFKDGDDMDMNIGDNCTTVIDDEKQRRREEIQWKEQIMDRMLGVQTPQQAGQQTSFYAAPTELGGFDDDFDREDNGYDTLEDADNENELDRSVESLVTHIRTPPHDFVVEEDETCEELNKEEFSPQSSSDTFYSANSRFDNASEIPSPPLSFVPKKPNSCLLNSSNKSKTPCSDPVTKENSSKSSDSLLSMLVRRKGAKLKLL